VLGLGVVSTMGIIGRSGSAEGAGTDLLMLRGAASLQAEAELAAQGVGGIPTVWSGREWRMFAGMSTTRRTAFARLAALAARPEGWRITHLYAADPARRALFALAEAGDLDGFRALRGES
jgi:hypothetical protein